VVFDRLGERVLHVGVDVHLHDAVRDRRLDLVAGGTAAAVEDEVEAARAGDSPLELGKQLRPEVNVAGRVTTVDIAERRCEEIAAALAQAERPRHRQGILRGRVKALARSSPVVNAVLFAADGADLQLEQDVELVRLSQQLGGHAQVLRERELRAIEHVRVEQRLLTALAPPTTLAQQRPDEVVDVVRCRVVGVQGDQHGRARGEHVREVGECSGANSQVGRGTGKIPCGARCDLDNAVRACVGEAAKRRVQRLG
jgi:hypothetical protein